MPKTPNHTHRPAANAPRPLTPLRARVLARCSLGIDPWAAERRILNGTRSVSQAVAWCERSCLVRCHLDPLSGAYLWNLTPLGRLVLRQAFERALS